MINTRKKLLLYIFSVVLTVFSALNIPVYAIEADISAECAVVLNADTNELIYSKNPFTQKSMASTTKIMTSLIAVESGLLMNEVTVTDEIYSEGSSIGLKKGDILTLESLVYAMMLESGNDAAEVTAEYFSGNEELYEAFKDHVKDNWSFDGMKATYIWREK